MEYNENRLTMGQASSFLGINPQTLRIWAWKGKIAYERYECGCMLFRPDELEKVKLYIVRGDQAKDDGTK